MWFAEYALQPRQRSGKMIPVSSLPDFYSRDDAGYSSYYWFREEDAQKIVAQGNSKDLSQYSVYTKYLVLDIDREDDMAQAKRDLDLYTNDIVLMGLKHSVWVSGGKGYHVYIHCEPMEGVDVPFSQYEWVRQRGWNVDMTLYQHGRLLSNPGRKSIKTGVRKHKIGDYDGRLLHIPRSQKPDQRACDTVVTDRDRARVIFNRLGRALESDPSSRHTTLWSLAGGCAEAGIGSELTTQILRFVNSLWTKPKDNTGLDRAIAQAYSQMRISPSLSSRMEVGPPVISED